MTSCSKSIQKNSGSVIVYATEEGGVAEDGSGTNSLFTAEFLHQLSDGNKDIFDFYKSLTKGVSLRTGGHQIPWISASVDSVFYFNDRLQDKNIGLLKLVFFDSCRNNFYALESH